LRNHLPLLLTRLARIPDVRHPRKCRHKLTVKWSSPSGHFAKLR
jgi:hypothetical protein